MQFTPSPPGAPSLEHRSAGSPLNKNGFVLEEASLPGKGFSSIARERDVDLQIHALWRFSLGDNFAGAVGAFCEKKQAQGLFFEEKPTLLPSREKNAL